MNEVYIIHGWTGWPGEGWFPWLKQKLTVQGVKVVIPAMTADIVPELDSWLKILNKTIKSPTNNTVLVGHSLGCPAILNYLNQSSMHHKFKAIVLVAGSVRDVGIEEVNDFINKDLDWDGIKKKVDKIIVIHSQDDKVVPIIEGRYIAKKLDAEMIEVEDCQHFSGGEGATEAQPVLEAIENIEN